MKRSGSADRYSLMRIGEAWRNPAGLRTVVVTFVALSALLALAGAIRVPVISALINVICILLLLMGSTAAGMQYMEQASGRPVRGTAASLMGSPLVLLRSLGLGLGIAAGAAALVLVAALLLALCRIPALGEVLYIAVLPAVTMLGAVGALVTLVAVLLAAPALWEGHSLRTTVLQLWAVVTQKPLEAFIQLATLVLAAMAVAAILITFVGFGFGAAIGLSALMLSRGAGDSLPAGIDGLSFMGFLYGGEMMGPGAVGAGIVAAIVVALVMAVLYLGLSIVHLRLTAGLDLAQAHETAARLMARTRSRAVPATAAAAASVTPAGAAVIDPDSVPFLVDGSTILPLAIGCPRCLANVTPGDAFCGNCGHKLA